MLQSALSDNRHRTPSPQPREPGMWLPLGHIWTCSEAARIPGTAPAQRQDPHPSRAWGNGWKPPSPGPRAAMATWLGVISGSEAAHWRAGQSYVPSSSALRAPLSLGMPQPSPHKVPTSQKMVHRARPPPIRLPTAHLSRAACTQLWP